tara:strand:- start:309 stop:566 length:258 start_codon:yes stop_codon:yes gene_type:complete
METKSTSTKKNSFSIDDSLKNGFLEDYELDIYNIEKPNSLHKPFEDEKSLYQKVKDEATIWLITGVVVGGAYLIDKYFKYYLDTK